MSIMAKLFGMQQPAPTPAPVPNNGINTPNAGVADPANSFVPPGTVDATKNEETPLADFAKLWEIEPPKEGEVPQQVGVFGNLDPKKVQETVSRANFTQVVTPELLAKAQQGGEEGVKAMLTAMNAMAQQVLAQSTMASTKMIDHALGKNRENFLGELPSHLNKHIVANQLRADNPALNNPAVQPLIKAMEQQFVNKYPNATPTEITQMATNYIAGLGQVFSPAPMSQESTQNKGETDWTNFV